MDRDGGHGQHGIELVDPVLEISERSLASSTRPPRRARSFKGVARYELGRHGEAEPPPSVAMQLLLA